MIKIFMIITIIVGGVLIGRGIANKSRRVNNAAKVQVSTKAETGITLEKTGKVVLFILAVAGLFFIFGYFTIGFKEE